MQPFVAITDARPAFRLAAREVEALVEVPLAELCDLSVVGEERRLRDGAPVDVPFFALQGRRVWGATAMILGEFAALISSGSGPRGRPRPAAGC